MVELKALSNPNRVLPSARHYASTSASAWQDCPSGLVKEETFKLIYAQYFPRGADSSTYAHFIFNTFDPDHTGGITFTVSALIYIRAY